MRRSGPPRSRSTSSSPARAVRRPTRAWRPRRKSSAVWSQPRSRSSVRAMLTTRAAAWRRTALPCSSTRSHTPLCLRRRCRDISTSCPTATASCATLCCMRRCRSGAGSVPWPGRRPVSSRSAAAKRAAPCRRPTHTGTITSPTRPARACFTTPLSSGCFAASCRRRSMPGGSSSSVPGPPGCRTHTSHRSTAARPCTASKCRPT